MEDEKRLLYAIWLNQTCGHDPVLIHRVLKHYVTAENAFHAKHFDSQFLKLVNLKRILHMDRSLDSAKRLLEDCRKRDILVFDHQDVRYPKGLKNIYQPPTLLYSKGKLPDLNRILGISVVGTRRPTKDGEKITRILGRDLAKNGAVIVSGMAMGIDGAAHCGALEAGGATLAVLAGGVDVIYPTEHTDMYQHILTHGAVLSEQPPGMVGKPNFYKQRNRIIIGLSMGTIVVEGEIKSGTSMSARLAVENNRDLFAVPGNPVNPSAALPNALLKDGAKQTTGALDVLEEYLELYPEQLTYGVSLIAKPVVGQVEELNHPSKTPVREPKKKEKPSLEELKHQLMHRLSCGEFRDEEITILTVLCESEDTVTFDVLAERTQLNPASLSSMLVILQMKGLVLQQAGGQFSIHLDFAKNL